MRLVLILSSQNSWIKIHGQELWDYWINEKALHLDQWFWMCLSWSQNISISRSTYCNSFQGIPRLKFSAVLGILAVHRAVSVNRFNQLKTKITCFQFLIYGRKYQYPCYEWTLTRNYRPDLFIYQIVFIIYILDKVSKSIVQVSWGSHGLTLMSAWIRNHMPSKVWDEITYPFPNFNGCTVEV